MVLVLCEMQPVSSRIWTRVAVSISNNYNHYTTDTSYNIFVYQLKNNLQMKHVIFLFHLEIEFFKQRTTRLNSEFSFKIGCHKSPVYPIIVMFF